VVLTVDELTKLPLNTTPETRIKRLVVDYKKIQVVAIKTTRPGVFSRALLLPFSAVEAVSADAIKVAAGETSQNEDQYKDMNRFGDLIDKEVFTERKRYLGKVVTFKVDTETGLITTLWVKTPVFLRDLWRQILIVSRSQILEIQARAVVVDEVIIKAALKPAATADLNTQEPEEAALGVGTSSAE
jgi:sporulation protein YlmC with PRC-barrel domain